MSSEAITPPHQTPWPRTLWVMVLAATALAAGLRLHQLDTGSFWLDELYNVRSSARLLEGNWQWTKALGYIPTALGMSIAGVDPSAIDPESTHAWRAAGIDERTARLPTALLGILSIPILALASRRLLGDRGAILLAFLLAVSPWHIYWSQAARFYIVQFLFYNLALLLYFTATRPMSRQRFIIAVAFAVLAFMSQPTAAILAAVFAVDWLVSTLTRRPGDPATLDGYGWSLALAAMTLCALLFTADHLVGSRTLVEAVSDPIHQSPLGVILASAYLIGPAALVGLSALLWMWAHDDRRLAVYLGSAAILPILIFAALAAFLPVGSRYAFVSAFAWVALAAIGLDRLWQMIRPSAGAALAAAPAVVALAASLFVVLIAFASEGNLHARWRDGIQTVKERRAPGEPVFSLTPYIAAYYLQEPVHPLPYGPGILSDIDTPAWFVIDNTGRRRSSRFWLLPDAELIDSFPLRAPHARSSVQVYRHDPESGQGPADTQTALAGSQRPSPPEHPPGTGDKLPP